MAGVPLTQAEWDRAVGLYPNLFGHRDDCLKMDGPTKLYNCLAWSMGSTTEWINPPKAQVDFEALYAQRGFRTCPTGEATADGYAKNNVMTHGSRFYLGVWSSKRGENMRMTHPRYGLTDASNTAIYGNVVVSFKPNVNFQFGDVELPAPTEAEREAASQITGLVDRSAVAFPMLADDFTKNWDAWEKSWAQPSHIESQSSSDFAAGPEWDALVKMGTSILPQVVKKLQTSANIFGCDLYNKLQPDPTKKVPATDLSNYFVLNNQAKQIIKLYGSHLDSFNRLANDLATHQSSVADRESGSSRDYTSGPSYEGIRALGAVGVPFIMDLYARDQDGWWHELLFEIVHGKPSSTAVFDKKVLYRQWSLWYQGGAPPGAPAAITS